MKKSNYFLNVHICLTGLIFLSSLSLFAQNGVGVNTSTPKSSFEDNGSFGKKVTTLTANTTLDDTYGSVVLNNGATAVTITLPAASGCAARIYELKRNSSSTANVTISVASAGTIDGSANYILTKAGQSVTVFSDGTAWQSRDGSGEAANWSLTGNTGTSATNNYLGTTDATDLVFRTNGVEKMRVESGGDVGIGTNNPTSKLEVVSGTSNANTITSINTSTSGYSSVDFRDNASALKFTIGYSNAAAANFAGKAYSNTYGNDYVLSRTAPSSDFFMKGTNGFIGVGNAVPQQNLSVQNGVNIDQAGANSGTVANALTFGSTSGEGIGSKRTATGNQYGLDFYTTSTNRMAITGAGNVGVGTIAPLSLLEISGSFAKKVTFTGLVNLALTATHSTIVCNNAATAITVTLPAASTCSGRIYEIKKDALSTANVTIGGSSNIDGNATFILTAINTSLILFSDGTEWKTLQGGQSLNGTAWALAGNSGTDPASQFLGTTDAQDLVVKTSNTERIRVKESGFVGVNLNSPSSYLHVRESSAGVKTTPFIIQNKSEVINSEVALRLAPTNSENVRGAELSAINRNGTNSIDLRFLLSDGTVPAERMRLIAEGNLGVNITVPISKLHVVGDGAKTINYAGTFLANTATSSANGRIKKGVEITSTGTWNGANAVNIGVHVSSVTGGTFNYDAIFNGGGNVGIGTADPTSKLDVNGSFAAKYNAVSADLTLTDAHYSIVSTAPGTITISLPAASTCADRIYVIAATGGGAITLASPAGAAVNQFYNFSTTATAGTAIIGNGTSRTFISDGTNWRRIQ